MFKGFHKNVFWLMLAQACFIGSTMTVVTYSGLVGTRIAPSDAFATLPMFCAIGTTALTTGLFSKLMGAKGRKAGFFLGNGLGIFGSLLAAYAVYIENFWLFCGSLSFVGMFAGTALYYRFMAIESVEKDVSGRAVSAVLIGSLIGVGFVPFITGYVMDLFAPDVLRGAFVFAAVSIALGLIPLSMLTPIDMEAEADARSGISKTARPLREIAKQPVFMAAVLNAATGYALMSFIMTSSPIAMDHYGMGAEVSRHVIQMHVFAMYLPSLFTGQLITRFGTVRILFAGHALFIAAFITAIMGITFLNFSVALILLGVGWNFCFIGGTTMLPRAYHAAEKTSVQGLNESLTYTSQATATAATGFLLHYFGWVTLNQIGLVLLAVTIFFTMRYAFSPDREMDH